MPRYILSIAFLLSFTFVQAQVQTPEQSPNYTGKSTDISPALELKMYLEESPEDSDLAYNQYKGYFIDSENEERFFIIGLQTDQGFLDLEVLDEAGHRLGYLKGKVDNQGVIRGVKQDEFENEVYSFEMYPKGYPQVR